MKKLITTLLLSFCLLGLVFLSSCESEDVFDITGRWTLSLTYPVWGTQVGFIHFAPPVTEDSETFIGSLTTDFSAIGWPPGYGTYTVTGTSVEFKIYWPEVWNSTDCIGIITSDDAMSGSFTEINQYSGIWAATR